MIVFRLDHRLSYKWRWRSLKAGAFPKGSWAESPCIVFCVCSSAQWHCRYFCGRKRRIIFLAVLARSRWLCSGAYRCRNDVAVVQIYVKIFVRVFGSFDMLILETEHSRSVFPRGTVADIHGTVSNVANAPNTVSYTSICNEFVYFMEVYKLPTNHTRVLRYFSLK